MQGLSYHCKGRDVADLEAIRYSTSANTSSEMHHSENAPREMSILSLWFEAELSRALSSRSHQWHFWNPWGGLSSPLINVASALRGVLINFSLQRALSGPETFVLHRQMVTAHTPPTADPPSGCWILLLWIPTLACQPGRQKGGGIPKPLKHFVPVYKKAARTIVMKSLPDGKALNQEL